VSAIAAGAFGWRAIARELVGHIPFGGGLIPKASIAYAVTYALGKGLESLYLSGSFHTREESRAIYHRALDRGKAGAGEFRSELGPALAGFARVQQVPLNPDGMSALVGSAGLKLAAARQRLIDLRR